MIRSSEWGQTHHSSADCTLPVSHIQAPKCTELAAIRHLGKYQQKLGFNKDRMGHDVSHTHKFINCPSLSILMAPMGSANPLLHRKEKVFGPRVNLEQSSATKAVFRETWPLIHILAWHKRFISRYHVCVCVSVCLLTSHSALKIQNAPVGSWRSYRIRECMNVWSNLCPSIKVKLHFFDLCCKMPNIIQLPGSM